MKKFLLMLLMSASAFAAGGFELAVNVPVLVSVGLPLGNGEKRKVDAYGSSGITVQLGYGAYYENDLGFSVLGEIGYAFNQFANYYPDRGNKETIVESFHSLQLGLLPKFNTKNFSIGLGGGVKIPGMATYRVNGYNKGGRYRFSFGDLNDIFESAVIPYLRFSLDFSLFNYLLIGVYVNYDFPLYFQHNNYMNDVFVNRDSISAFDIGIQFGYYLNINFDRDY